MTMCRGVRCATIFEVRGEIDANEGRGGTRSCGFYYQEDLANEAAKGKGVFGGPGRVDKITGYLFDLDGDIRFVKPTDLHEVLSEPKEKVVARAKAKLTKDELVALGIK
jgi:hypothetical protein